MPVNFYLVHLRGREPSRKGSGVVTLGGDNKINTIHHIRFRNSCNYRGKIPSIGQIDDVVLFFSFVNMG